MIAVNHVAGHQQRDAQTRFLHANPLELVDLHRIHFVQDGADLSLPERIRIIGYIASGGNLVHLTDFLGQSHLGEDLLHAALHLRGCPDGGILFLLLAGDHG